ncbi:type II toxin-antitoxin system Phd/YefM family antitoxin [Demequina sp. SYSU T00192]|uniref:Antitoxin n=1 Tax=Demequina litoralis TaxID=3051660 RepID=A0ABT8G5P8_9MICO|nr:type II toxin-antitoxin system Phd/YefM family antitoxin [Demequina sp. SYSU T00192]MDN4474443.1 type II toxin-antitoxin system Phd/YefM family antitoxin [Demequina sp. SYSU T00192]
MTAISAREFNQNPSAAMRAADTDGPVVITHRGRAAYVLVPYESFAVHGRSLARQLAADDDIDFAPERTAPVEREVEL